MGEKLPNWVVSTHISADCCVLNPLDLVTPVNSGSFYTVRILGELGWQVCEILWGYGKSSLQARMLRRRNANIVLRAPH